MSDSVGFLGFPKGFEMSSVPSFVVVNCPFCKKTAQVAVNAAEFEDWQAGELIQNAMPNLDADSREQLISGTCPKCWDEMFGDYGADDDFDLDDDDDAEIESWDYSSGIARLVDDQYEDQDW